MQTKFARPPFPQHEMHTVRLALLSTHHSEWNFIEQESFREGNKDQRGETAFFIRNKMNHKIIFRPYASSMSLFKGWLIQCELYATTLLKVHCVCVYNNTISKLMYSISTHTVVYISLQIKFGKIDIIYFVIKLRSLNIGQKYE